jgi:hypothetical protein
MSPAGRPMKETTPMRAPLVLCSRRLRAAENEKGHATDWVHSGACNRHRERRSLALAKRVRLRAREPTRKERGTSMMQHQRHWKPSSCVQSACPRGENPVCHCARRRAPLSLPFPQSLPPRSPLVRSCLSNRLSLCVCVCCVVCLCVLVMLVLAWQWQWQWLTA